MDLKQQLSGMDHWPLMEEIIGFQVQPRRNYRSPVRDGDSDPSFGLYRAKRGGQAKWKDFGDEGGDVYALAMRIYRCDFRTAVRKVAQLAGLLPGSPRRFVRPVRLTPSAPVAGVRMDFEQRHWQPCDTDYWTARYGRTGEDLALFRIRPASVLRLHRTGSAPTEIRHSAGSPLYVMEIGGMGRIKGYSPLAGKKQRYIGNTRMEDIFGEHLLKGDGTPLVICAGQKDAMNFALETGLQAIAMNSESVMPSPDTVASLAIRTNAPIMVMYDNDNAGSKHAAKLVERFPLIGRIKLSEFTDLKDFSDLLQQEGRGAMQAFTENIKRTIEHAEDDRQVPGRHPGLDDLATDQEREHGDDALAQAALPDQ